MTLTLDRRPSTSSRRWNSSTLTNPGTPCPTKRNRKASSTTLRIGPDRRVGQYRNDRHPGFLLGKGGAANPMLPHSNVARFAALEWGLYSLRTASADGWPNGLSGDSFRSSL